MTDTAYLAPSALDVSDAARADARHGAGAYADRRRVAPDVLHRLRRASRRRRRRPARGGRRRRQPGTPTSAWRSGSPTSTPSSRRAATACGSSRSRPCNGVYARFDLAAGRHRLRRGRVRHHQRRRQPAAARRPRVRASRRAVAPRRSAATPCASPPRRPPTSERKVPLPDRWVRGFAETPLLPGPPSRCMELHRTRRSATFLGELPRISSGPGPDAPPAARAGPASARRPPRPARVAVRCPGRGVSSPPAASCGSRPDSRPRRHPAGHHRLALRGARRRAHPAADAAAPTRASPARAACSSCSPTPMPNRCRPVPAHPPRVGAAGRPRRARRRLRDTHARSVDAGLAWLSSLGPPGLRHHGRRLVPPRAPGRLRPDRARQPASAVGPQDHRHRARRRRLADARTGAGRRPDRPARPARRRQVGVHVPLGGGAPRHPRAVQARPRGGAGPAGRHLSPVEDTPDRRVALGVGGLVLNLY